MEVILILIEMIFPLIAENNLVKLLIRNMNDRQNKLEPKFLYATYHSRLSKTKWNNYSGISSVEFLSFFSFLFIFPKEQTFGNKIVNSNSFNSLSVSIHIDSH